MVLLLPVFLGGRAGHPAGIAGPILFKQTRVGRWGRLFTMWKFRSMYIDAEARKAELMAQNEMAGGVIFKMKDDPRVTKVGKFIRKTSIDELPQLWNVMTGEMSLVGPRPPVPPEVDQYSLSDRRRLEVIPGITCIWQVSGRSEIPFDQQVELDVQYIESQSFWTDIKILLKTVPALLFGTGAWGGMSAFRRTGRLSEVARPPPAAGRGAALFGRCGQPQPAGGPPRLSPCQSRHRFRSV
jgi:lipopolysaccharide/colanic/teichoic acid biosynthesis glycosyltransferase